MSPGSDQSGGSARSRPDEGGAIHGVQQAWGVVVIGDAGGVIQWVSPSVEEILGYPPGELVGRPGLGMVHPDDVAVIDETWQLALLEPGASTPPRTRAGATATGRGASSSLCSPTCSLSRR